MRNKTVAITVAFNFFHEGHIDHIEEAMRLGDRLIVIVANDEALQRQKGKHNYPLDVRLGIGRVIKWLNPLNRLVVSIDKDNTVAETLRMIKPDIFAKGGDRIPQNMPPEEIEVCKEIGCEIVYGVGTQRDKSSRIKELIFIEKI